MELKNELEVKKYYETSLNNDILLKRVAVIGGGVVILGLTSTILVSALTAGLALSGLAVVGTATFIGGVYVYKSIPGWITSIENKVIQGKHQAMLKHLESMKSMVKKNPIEQLEFQLQEKTKRLNIFAEGVVKLKTSVANQKRNLKAIKKENPHYDMSEEEEQTVKMEEYVDFKEAKLNEAKETLSKFKDTVKQVKVKWEFQLSAKEAISAMDESDKESMMQELLTETAFTEVFTSYEGVFSRMEIELNQMEVNPFDKTPKTISYSKDDVYVGEIVSKEKVNG